MERLLQLFDRNSHEILKRKVIQSLKNNSSYIPIRRDKRSSTDLVIKPLLNVKAIALEETLEDSMGIRLAAIRGKGNPLQIIEGNHLSIGKLVIGINCEYNVLRELRHKLNIVKTIHLAAKYHVNLPSAKPLRHSDVVP